MPFDASLPKPLYHSAPLTMMGGIEGDDVADLAEEAIAGVDHDDFILDGYPRTVEQAEWLTAFLERHEAPLTAVVSLEVPEETIVDRLSKRRVHRVTGANYHLDFRPPPADVDPELIVQRPDDRPEAVQKRLRVYAQETEPVEQYYAERDELFRVDGVGSVEEVFARIDDVLKQATAAR